MFFAAGLGARKRLGARSAPVGKLTKTAVRHFQVIFEIVRRTACRKDAARACSLVTNKPSTVSKFCTAGEWPVRQNNIAVEEDIADPPNHAYRPHRSRHSSGRNYAKFERGGFAGSKPTTGQAPENRVFPICRSKKTVEPGYSSRFGEDGRFGAKSCAKPLRPIDR